ncbi:MAG: recombination-associated protein RdgC [Pseudomonadota bacterium]
MWFKNLRAYRMTRGLDLNAEQIEEALQARTFQACRPTQAQTFGWVPALGADTESLLHMADGYGLLRLRREEKILPASVVRELLDERVKGIEEKQGRKVYRKEKLSLKEEIVIDSLPRAFSRHSELRLLLDKERRWVFVDSVSANKAEEALNLLRECIGSFPVLPAQSNNAPTAAINGWLMNGTLPDDFQLRDECELQEIGEQSALVRCKGIDLRSEEVLQHLRGGMLPIRVALEWQEQLQFVLGEDLALRRMRFADALVKENDELFEEDPLAKLDADFALMAPAISNLFERLIGLFGGPDTA